MKKFALVLICLLLVFTTSCHFNATQDDNSGASSEESSSSLQSAEDSVDESFGAVSEESKGDSSLADSSAPESSKADSSVPDSSAPESSKADSSVPDSSAVDSSMTDSSEEESSKEESSEESVYVPVDLNAPLVEIPNDLKYEPIDEFFNNSVFIGYSIMMHFGRYTDNWRDTIDYRILGTAEFRCGVGMSFTGNEYQDPSDPQTPLPKHNGVAYHFEDLPAAMGVDAIYLGLTPYSDMRSGSVSDCAYNGAQTVKRTLVKIKENNPNVRIVVLAGTYNTGEDVNDALNYSRVNNANIRKYNNYVLSYCNELGIDFVDVATPMTNGNGYFVKEWASDGEYHIRQEPYKIWIQVLRDYAARKDAGTWQNRTEMPELGKLS